MSIGRSVAGAHHVMLAALAAFGLLPTPGAAAAGDPARSRPNVLVIVADDLGYGDLSCYGATDIDTPHLDAMAAAGVRLTDFHAAASVCTPSRAALLTGCQPRRISLTRVLHPHDASGLAMTETTLGELLQRAGYATGCFGKWHLGHHEPFLPHHHGFDETLVIPYSHDMYRGAPWGSPAFTGTWPDHVPLLHNGEKIAELRGLEAFASLTGRFTDAACDFIRRRAKRPFFLYVPYTLPHLELAAPEGWRGASRRGPYGDAVAELDAAVGRILAVLEEQAVATDTLVVFTSDNGPAQIYQQPPFPGGSARPFSGGKNSGFEGGWRVPCLMRWPKSLPRGRTCAALCSAIDLFPTVAAIVGVALPDTPLDGRDLFAVLRNPDGAHSPHDGLLLYKDETSVALRTVTHKLWLPNTPFNKSPRPRLFDLTTDPAEQHDLEAADPVATARLLEQAATLTIPARDVRAAGRLPAPSSARQ